MNEYEKIYPITCMGNVIDEDTNDNLYQYLAEYNHINLGYCASKEDARRSVRPADRKKCLYISYYLEEDIITEIFKGDVSKLDDDEFVKDENWQQESITQLVKSIPIPDDEDISLVKNGLFNTIRFADKKYSPAAFSGKGFKILRRKISNITVDDRNVPVALLTQADFADEDTIYLIKYSFNLGKATIKMPANSTILLYGGVITNGTINGNYSELAGIGTIDCNLKGTWTNYGISTTRPRTKIIGTCYFDTKLEKPIWWQGSYWVDATGKEV